MKYIASLSYGKDSIAMLEVIKQHNMPLDRIVHVEIMATDTIPADLPPMVEFKKHADKIIKQRYGIEVEHIRAPKSYEEWFYHIYGDRSKKAGEIYGFPYSMGAWCNSRLKTNILRKFNKPDIHQYIGYAIDEKKKERQEKIQIYLEGQSTFGGSYPLVDCSVTEKECLNWCKENDLLSPIYSQTTRGGCWFCHNSTLQELRMLREQYPKYWSLMLKWDNDSPTFFKTDGTTVHDLDERFEFEDAQIKFW